MCVPNLKKDLVSTSCLENKGYRVILLMDKFLYGGKTRVLIFAKVTSVREGGKYRLLGQSIQALLQNSTDKCELLHQTYANIH